MKLEEAIKSSTFTSGKQKASLNILYTAWWLKSIISQELKEFLLTNEQFNVLRILKGKHPEQMCVKDIGSRMIEPSSNVPRIIDRLVLKEFVQRSTSIIDKRETVIALTNEGNNILAKASEHINASLNNLITLTDEEAVHLNLLLDNIRKEQ